MEASQNVPVSTPQITTVIQINGNQMVAFGTDIDWAESMSLTVESPDAAQCIKRVSEWLGELEIYPWGNLADHQEYANQTQAALTDPLIYAQIREYVLNAHSQAFTYLPMNIGYLTVAFTFRRVDLTFTLEEESEADIQNQIAKVETEFDLEARESERAAREQAGKAAAKEFDFVVNLQSTKMPFLVSDFINEDGVLVTNMKKPEMRGELKQATVTELLSFLLTVGTTITAPDETTTAVALAQHAQAFTRLKERFFARVPGVGSTFTENCEIVEVDDDHGLSISIRVTLID